MKDADYRRVDGDGSDRRSARVWELIVGWLAFGWLLFNAVMVWSRLRGFYDSSRGLHVSFSPDAEIVLITGTLTNIVTMNLGPALWLSYIVALVTIGYGLLRERRK